MRAFLAVAIATELRERVSAVQQQLKDLVAAGPGRRMRITWVKPETIHLTIKFLGEIDEASVDQLSASVIAAIAGSPAIDIPFATIGAFPRPQAPRALWIGPPSTWDSQEEANRALELAVRIDAACEKFAVPRDTHPWRPHLTVARVREGERDAGRVLETSGLMARTQDIGTLHVDKISLMKSEMRPDGPVHTPLWTVAVAG
jgi:RNA 2',3'-cyclic 3'-phosphodiesterase